MTIGTFKDFYTLYAEAFLPEGEPDSMYLYRDENNVYELSDDPCRNNVTPIGRFQFSQAGSRKITKIDGVIIPNVYSALQFSQTDDSQSSKGVVLKLFRYKADKISQHTFRGGEGQATEMSDDAVMRIADIINNLQPQVIYKVASKTPTFNNNVIDMVEQAIPVIDLSKRDVKYFVERAIDKEWVIRYLMGHNSRKAKDIDKLRRVPAVIARAYFTYLTEVKSGQAQNVPVSIDEIAVAISEVTSREGFINRFDNLSEAQIEDARSPREIKTYLRPNNFYNFDNIEIQNVPSVILDDNLNLGNTFIEVGRVLRNKGVAASNIDYAVGVLWKGKITNPCEGEADARAQAEIDKEIEDEATAIADSARVAGIENTFQNRDQRARQKDFISKLESSNTTFNTLVRKCAEIKNIPEYRIRAIIMQSKRENIIQAMTTNANIRGEAAANIAEYIFDQ
jgi:hypothetical protein